MVATKFRHAGTGNLRGTSFVDPCSLHCARGTPLESLGLEGRALVTNLSPRGLSLSSSLDLDPGTRVEITIALGFAAEEVTVEAEVLYAIPR